MQSRTRLFVLTLVLVIIAMIATVAQPARAQSPQLSGNLEIFSWWTGDEAPALDALLKLYNTKYPDVNVTVRTVAGGSGVNAKAVLKMRMLGGDPPDSFQVHAGQELIGSWVVSNRMEPLDDLFQSEGWNDKFPKGLLDLLTYQGHIWSVPANIHRANVIWYVPANLETWGVEVPKTWDEFLQTCQVLKSKNVVPLALGPTWTAMHLFENVMLGTLGPDDYRNVWSGKLKWTDDKVRHVWEVYSKVLDCTNSDAASLDDWPPAAQMVLDGKAAFQVMGDWWAGWATSTKQLVPGTDFDWALAPGTQGDFLMLSDSFGLPKNVKDMDNTMAWLKLVGSVEGQDTLTPLQGAIPSRIDADVTNPKLYNDYLRGAAADWTKDTIVPSLTHGAAAPQSFIDTFTTILEVFAQTRDSGLATAAAQQQAVDSNIGQY